jgi:hypothetical protein
MRFAAPRPHRNHRRASSGVAIVELALVATVLLTLLLGIIEIGRALTEYKVLVNQVETAARYLATRSPGSGASEARCLVTHGSTTCSGALFVNESLESLPSTRRMFPSTFSSFFAIFPRSASTSTFSESATK